MKTHKRFIIQFLFQLFILFLFLLVLLLITFVLIAYFSERVETFDDLTKASDLFIENRVNIDEETATFDQDLQVLAEEQDGWLAALTEEGEIIGSFHAPDHLTAGNLTAVSSSNELDIKTYWEVITLSEQVYYVIFGSYNSEVKLVEELKEHVNWQRQKLELLPSSKQELDNNHYWAILINDSGSIVDSYGHDVPSSYHTDDLLAIHSDQNRQLASSYVHQPSQLTLIVGKEPSPSSLKINYDRVINNSVIVGIVFILLFLLLATFWYVKKFSSPLLTLMSWIQNLGQGIYQPPTDQRTGQSVLLNKHGNTKRSYRLYKGLIATLTQLTTILQEREAEQSRTSRSREEWIRGISHDLKTPLASIQGYANMMEASDYSWNEEEIREFASIIGEKSIYMKELIEDLNVTYQLKNQELPIVKERANINECIRRTIIQFMNNPIHNNKELRFQPAEQDIVTAFDHKWFQRIMENLIANAIKYNPAGTIITISTEQIEQHLIVIKISDDGVGMDRETVQHLFTRYYRGTNTTDTNSGTGLGLAITKQLIELHNGSISVQSKLGSGTTIRILLPILEK
ncbi:HAMP domain-containing sensor histidine kinase [Gracilibacillus sp. S3-1-1]|uniref:HAMP domain-containing sensor histidine kinase n=1 Tax=Gracilibacillus pellucidus TaxID=3095368 RepID=A0ACC6M3C0_9BACI|nr:HAMP domain-containing sensor histidine kinase [Gracilibacillus sp. S3-1-1]MDX8045365.1 HAMP domain-containing sensor histidine kinase [Gracilibacillus sp. S3-1-1]